MIKVILCNDSSPEFVEPQYASFKKHLQEDFELVVVGSPTFGKKPDKAREVRDVCNSLSIPYIEVQRDAEIEATHLRMFPREIIFGADGRYSTYGNAGNYMMQWSWQRVAAVEKGLVCYVHSDVFLVEPIKFSDYLQEHSICCCVQHYPANEKHGPLDFLWEPLLLADMSKLPNPETMVWWPSSVEGDWTDTGGQTYYYLKAHPEVKLRDIKQSGCGVKTGPGHLGEDDDPNVDFHPARYRFMHLDDKKVFHYLSGSRWCTEPGGTGWRFSQEKSDEYHAKKLAFTRKLIGI